MAAIKRPVVKRADPPPRQIDPIEGMSRIVDADPAMRYVWIPEHGMLNTEYYESLGYTKVVYEEGGARPVRVGKSTRGGPIMQFGSILMQIPKADYQEAIYGPGQERMNVLERKIYDKEMARREISEVDGMRGMLQEEVIDAVNMTSPLTPGI